MINGRVVFGLETEMKDSCWKSVSVLVNPLCSATAMLKTSELLQMNDI